MNYLAPEFDVVGADFDSMLCNSYVNMDTDINGYDVNNYFDELE